MNTSKTTKDRLFRALTWSTIAAVFTTYTHFFGYSFIKGKLGGMGFGNVSISPSLNESLFQANNALLFFLDTTLKADIFDPLFNPSLVYASISFLLLLGFLYRDNISKNLKSIINNSKGYRSIKPKYRFLKNLIIAGGGSFFVFSLPYVVTFIIVFFLLIAWMTLALGNIIGYVDIESKIENGVCSEVTDERWEKNKRNFILSCIDIQFEGDNKPTRGKIIYSNKQRTYFVTNDAAFELDANRQILASVRFIQKPNEIEEGKEKEKVE